MGWLRKRSLSERQARDILTSTLLEDERADDVFSSSGSGAVQQRERSKSFTGASSSREPGAVDKGEVSPQASSRRHQSMCVPGRRGTEVAGEGSPGAQLLRGHPGGRSGSPAASCSAGPAAYSAQRSPDRASVVSTVAVTSSPPGTLGSEVPSSWPGGSEGRGAGSVMHGGESSRPQTGGSHSTRLSQHSVIQLPGLDGPPKRRRSNNFFRGDIKSSSHQLQKASIVAAKRYSATKGGRPAIYRRSRESLVSSSAGSEASLPGALAASGGGLLGAGVGAHSSSSLGGDGTPRSRNSSILDRLRFGISPAGLRAIVSRQSTGDLLSPRAGSDGRFSVGTDARYSMATDLQSVLGMSGQVLEAATYGMQDDFQRSAIQSQLGGDNINRRVAWMNRVLGSLYVDDDMVQDEDEDAHKDDVMFHPNSPFRARWDILIVLVIIYQVAVMPVRVVWGDNSIGLLFAVEMILSVLLMLDVFLSFHTGWENDGEIIMHKHRVRRHYLASWFVPELISSMPYDVLALLAQGEDPRSYRAISFRAVRFLALLRWPRLWRYIQKWQDLLAMDSIILKLAKYWLGLLMFIHTAGCMVALQAFLQRENPTSYFNRADFPSPPGDPPTLMERGPFVQYTYSLFRSTSGLLACGWGATSPISVEEVWMVLMVELLGSFMQLVFQAAILTLVRTYDRSTANYMQRMEMVKEFFARYDIPSDIRKRTVTQMLLRHTNRRLMRDEHLLRDMAPSMRVDLQVHLAATVLKQQPLFATWRPVVVRAVAAELVQGIFAPGDTIFFKGEMADCMYFVAEGVVRIMDPDSGKLVTTIHKGSYFGEFALLQGERGVRTASAEAATTTLLFSLSRKIFYRVAAHYPEMLDTLNIIAAARAALNSNQAVNAEDLLRIKNMRSSFLMNTCRAAVAQTILEEDEEEGEAQEEAFNNAGTAGGVG